MAGNPFLYGTPVEAEQFTGRSEEQRALVAAIRNHLNVVLFAPRRYGKTSLLLRAERQLRTRAGILHVNVFGAEDVGALASRLLTGAYKVRGGRWQAARDSVSEFVRSLRISPNVSIDATTGSPTFSLAAGHATRDAEQIISSVYARLNEIAEEQPVALVLDEFQAVAQLSPHLPSLFKSLADEYRQVSLIMAGSMAHLMEQMFFDKQNSPLYGMAQRITLGPIPRSEMTSFLRSRAKSVNIGMDRRVADYIVDLAWPTPNDIQRLAYHAYLVAEGEEITFADVDEGFALAVRLESASYSEVLTGVSVGQRKVLQRLAQGQREEPYGGEFVRSTGLANPSSVRKAVTALINLALVVEENGEYRVSDPFFARWLRDL